MFNTSSRRAASRQAGDRANPWRADRADERTFRLVKATLEIPAEVVRHQREVVDRAFAVLKSQWGLSSVELWVDAADLEASGAPSNPARHALKVGGYSFPLRLEYM